MTRWLVPGTYFVLFAGCGFILGDGLFGCSILGCLQRLRVKGNVCDVCFWVCNPLFSEAVADGAIDTLYENVAKSVSQKDACDFSRF